MLTSPTTCGRRCGASRRSTSACRRSASWMMTWVYSVSSRRVDLHLQQLRRAADAAQRVLDLVRQVADQLLVGLRLVERALLAVLPGLLLDLEHLDQHRRLGADRRSGLTITCTGRLGAAPRRLRCSWASKRPVAISLRATAISVSRSCAGVGEPVEQAGALQRAARHADHVFERRVGEQQRPSGATTATMRGQQVEGLEARSARPRGQWRLRALTAATWPARA